MMRRLRHARGGLGAGLVDARRLLRSREGATAVELALMAVPFFTLLLGVVEFSRVVWIRTAMQYAVERTARYAAINESARDTDKLRTYFTSQVIGPGSLAPNFSYATPACGYKVTATASLTLLLPYTVNLTAQSCHPLRG